MPQHTLFDGWNIVRMSFTVELPVNKPGGRITLLFEDELGKVAGMRNVQWVKPRDLNDVALVARDVTNAFMFAPQLEALDSLRVAFEKHCPNLTQEEMIG